MLNLTHWTDDQLQATFPDCVNFMPVTAVLPAGQFPDYFPAV